MAGDWLKVETITPDKPEVENIAHRLGITPEEAFGRVFRVWTWCQEVSADGHVRVRDLSPIDRKAGLTGFGQAMAEEGWIQPAADGFVIPKWDRHLSKGAKKRVLDAERKQRERHAAVPNLSASEADNCVTREEKRRTTPSLRSGVGRATRLPTDWTLSDELKAWTAEAQPTWDTAHLKTVLTMFRNHWKAASGRNATKLDWDATWQNWVLKEGPRKVNGHAVTASWKPGGEPQSILIAAGDRIGLKWHEPPNEGETIGQFRARIVAAGGEKYLAPPRAA